ncbi:MAG TPA: SDR family oxidoreductase [Planctomycetaceae bacterium]|nr:SDR family oxidoreductase [Planctomycetaceae bacterium]
MDDFKNKVAIVTGGGMGLGRALCTELARRGATVIVADIKADAAREVAERITKAGGQARSIEIDVSDRQAVVRLVADTQAQFGHLDLIINNAVTVIGGDARDISLIQWDRTLAVNLHGVLYGTIAAYQAMVRQGHGQIVNISSLTGLFPQPGNAPYCTAKHALVGLSLSLRFEGADLGVKVNCVCPGDMKTDIYENMTVMNMDRETIIRVSRRSHFLMPQWTAEEAADEILRGVARNKPLIIFPRMGRVIWRLYRACPSLIYWISLYRTRMFRRVRIEAKG